MDTYPIVPRMYVIALECIVEQGGVSGTGSTNGRSTSACCMMNAVRACLRSGLSIWIFIAALWS